MKSRERGGPRLRGPRRGKKGRPRPEGRPREGAPRARTSGTTGGSEPLARTPCSTHRAAPDAARPGSGSPAPGGEGWTGTRLPRIPSQAAGPPLVQGQGPGPVRRTPRAARPPLPIAVSAGTVRRECSFPFKGVGTGVDSRAARCSLGFVGGSGTRVPWDPGRRSARRDL